MTVGRWALAAAAGLLAAAAALTGTWWYAVLAAAGLVFLPLALAYPRAVLVLWIVAAPTAAAYGTVELPGGIPDITFNRVVIATVTVALLLRSKIHGRAFAQVGPAEVAMLVLLGVLGLDFVARAQDRASEALQHFDETLGPCLLFVLARSLFGREGDGRRIAWALTISAALLGAHGTYQVIRGPGVGITDELVSLKMVEGGERVNESHYEEGRGVGPFVNAVEYGGVVAIGLGAALYLALHGGVFWSRLGAAVLIVPIACGVVASLTRSVWAGAIVGLMAMAMMDRSMRRWIVGGVVVGALALTVVFLRSDRAEAIQQRAESLEPVTGRLIMYRLAGELVIERPFTGYGSGLPTRQATLVKLLQSTDPDAYKAPGQFHNLFVMTLVEWGVFGLVARVLVHVGLAWGARLLRAGGPDVGPDDYYLGGMFLFATVVYLIQCFAVDMPAYHYLNGLYYFLGGVTYARVDWRRHAAVSGELATGRA